MLKKLSLCLLLSGVAVLSVSQSAYAMRQPAMDSALQALDDAEKILQGAEANKGGHRVKALQLIKKAQREVRQGIRFANTRAADLELKQRREREAREALRLQNEARERERRERELRERRNARPVDRNDRRRDEAASARDRKYNNCIKQARNNDRRIDACNKQFGQERREPVRERR
ncbi:MAG: hypothetical protein OEY36_01635 [Gammaproteobacteria bacterium]|nr:hypothetical protein [Gammaproteobacteria bacterium]